MGWGSSQTSLLFFCSTSVPVPFGHTADHYQGASHEADHRCTGSGSGCCHGRRLQRRKHHPDQSEVIRNPCKRDLIPLGGLGSAGNGRPLFNSPPGIHKRSIPRSSSALASASRFTVRRLTLAILLAISLATIGCGTREPGKNKDEDRPSTRR